MRLLINLVPSDSKGGSKLKSLKQSRQVVSDLDQHRFAVVLPALVEAELLAPLQQFSKPTSEKKLSAELLEEVIGRQQLNYHLRSLAGYEILDRVRTVSLKTLEQEGAKQRYLQALADAFIAEYPILKPTDPKQPRYLAYRLLQLFAQGQAALQHQVNRICVGLAACFFGVPKLEVFELGPLRMEGDALIVKIYCKAQSMTGSDPASFEAFFEAKIHLSRKKNDLDVTVERFDVLVENPGNIEVISRTQNKSVQKQPLSTVMVMQAMKHVTQSQETTADQSELNLYREIGGQEALARAQVFPYYQQSWSGPLEAASPAQMNYLLRDLFSGIMRSGNYLLEEPDGSVFALRPPALAKLRELDPINYGPLDDHTLAGQVVREVTGTNPRSSDPLPFQVKCVVDILDDYCSRLFPGFESNRHQVLTWFSQCVGNNAMDALFGRLRYDQPTNGTMFIAGDKDKKTELDTLYKFHIDGNNTLVFENSYQRLITEDTETVLPCSIMQTSRLSRDTSGLLQVSAERSIGFNSDNSSPEQASLKEPVARILTTALPEGHGAIIRTDEPWAANSFVLSTHPLVNDETSFKAYSIARHVLMFSKEQAARKQAEEYYNKFLLGILKPTEAAAYVASFEPPVVANVSPASSSRVTPVSTDDDSVISMPRRSLKSKAQQQRPAPLDISAAPARSTSANSDTSEEDDVVILSPKDPIISLDALVTGVVDQFPQKLVDFQSRDLHELDADSLLNHQDKPWMRPRNRPNRPKKTVVQEELSNLLGGFYFSHVKRDTNYREALLNSFASLFSDQEFEKFKQVLKNLVDIYNETHELRQTLQMAFKSIHGIKLNSKEAEHLWLTEACDQLERIYNQNEGNALFSDQMKPLFAGHIAFCRQKIEAVKEAHKTPQDLAQSVAQQLSTDLKEYLRVSRPGEQRRHVSEERRKRAGLVLSAATAYLSLASQGMPQNRDAIAFLMLVRGITKNHHHEHDSWVHGGAGRLGGFLDQASNILTPAEWQGMRDLQEKVGHQTFSPVMIASALTELSSTHPSNSAALASEIAHRFNPDMRESSGELTAAMINAATRLAEQLSRELVPYLAHQDISQERRERAFSLLTVVSAYIKPEVDKTEINARDVLKVVYETIQQHHRQHWLNKGRLGTLLDHAWDTCIPTDVLNNVTAAFSPALSNAVKQRLQEISANGLGDVAPQIITRLIDGQGLTPDETLYINRMPSDNWVRDSFDELWNTKTVDELNRRYGLMVPTRTLASQKMQKVLPVILPPAINLAVFNQLMEGVYELQGKLLELSHGDLSTVAATLDQIFKYLSSVWYRLRDHGSVDKSYRVFIDQKVNRALLQVYERCKSWIQNGSLTESEKVSLDKVVGKLLTERVMTSEEWTVEVLRGLRESRDLAELEQRYAVIKGNINNLNLVDSFVQVVDQMFALKLQLLRLPELSGDSLLNAVKAVIEIQTQFNENSLLTQKDKAGIHREILTAFVPYYTQLSALVPLNENRRSSLKRFVSSVKIEVDLARVKALSPLQQDARSLLAHLPQKLKAYFEEGRTGKPISKERRERATLIMAVLETCQAQLKEGRFGDREAAALLALVNQFKTHHHQKHRFNVGRLGRLLNEVVSDIRPAVLAQVKQSDTSFDAQTTYHVFLRLSKMSVDPAKRDRLDPKMIDGFFKDPTSDERLYLKSMTIGNDWIRDLLEELWLSKNLDDLKTRFQRIKGILTDNDQTKGNGEGTIKRTLSNSDNYQPYMTAAETMMNFKQALFDLSDLLSENSDKIIQIQQLNKKVQANSRILRDTRFLNDPLKQAIEEEANKANSFKLGVMREAVKSPSRKSPSKPFPPSSTDTTRVVGDADQESARRQIDLDPVFESGDERDARVAAITSMSGGLNKLWSFEDEASLHHFRVDLLAFGNPSDSRDTQLLDMMWQLKLALLNLNAEQIAQTGHALLEQLPNFRHELKGEIKEMLGDALTQASEKGVDLPFDLRDRFSRAGGVIGTAAAVPESKTLETELELSELLGRACKIASDENTQKARTQLSLRIKQLRIDAADENEAPALELLNKVIAWLQSVGPNSLSLDYDFCQDLLSQLQEPLTSDKGSESESDFSPANESGDELVRPTKLPKARAQTPVQHGKVASILAPGVGVWVPVPAAPAPPDESLEAPATEESAEHVSKPGGHVSKPGG